MMQRFIGMFRRSPAAQKRIGVRLGEADVVACDHGDVIAQSQQFQGMFGGFQSSAGGDRMRHPMRGQRIEQFMRAGQDAERERLV